MDTETSPELQQSIEALRQAVQILYEERNAPVRPPVVKARLRELLPTFSESTIGFTGFGDFLRAGEKAGVITLTPRAPDSLVTPPGVPVPTVSQTQSQPSCRPGRPIRLDLWRAFVHVGDYLRFYDPKADQAYSLPREAPQQESPSIAAIRAAFIAHPDEFISITPISEETQREWASELVSSGESLGAPETRFAVLDAAVNYRDLLNLLTADSSLRMAWHTLRLSRTTSVILAWCQEHKLTLDIFARPAKASPTSATSPRPLAGAELPDIQNLRVLLKDAIDQMPLKDLLSISIPLEFLVRSPRGR